MLRKHKAKTKLRYIVVDDILNTTFDGHLDWYYYTLYKNFLQDSLVKRPELSDQVATKLVELEAAFKRKTRIQNSVHFVTKNKIKGKKITKRVKYKHNKNCSRSYLTQVKS